jgi:hypothetical protein
MPKSTPLSSLNPQHIEQGLEARMEKREGGRKEGRIFPNRLQIP